MSIWITDSQDEQTLEELLRDTDQLHIPIFQRAYVWKQKQFDELIDDINLIKSEIEITQFLGAIVSYEKPRQTQIVGRLRALAVVDGQQRLLTLIIFVMALVELVATIDKVEAIEIVREFLLLPPRRGLEINTRIVPAFGDRSQFRVLWDRLNGPNVLQGEFSDNLPHPPPPSGESGGELFKQYNRILRFVRTSAPKDTNERLDYYREFLDIVTRKLTFVHLKLNDASSATKIFERLNFRGVRVGIVDLVRNEIFSGLAEDPKEAQRVFDHVWRPFEENFEGRSEAFFFPYCLIHDSNTKKSELFSHLRDTWKALDPEGMVKHMMPYQGPFMMIDSTGEYAGNPEISIRLERLVRMKRPTSIYPYVISILHAHENGDLSEHQCVSLLDALESFLVRRAIVGFEPTGLHALFKGLWGQLVAQTVDEFIGLVSAKPTIQWPNDQELREAIATRSIAKTNICNYLLVEYDKSIPGDKPDAMPTIEHILPQSYEDTTEWAKSFSKEEHKRLKDTWANLLPLTSPLNSSLQAGPYADKRPRYSRESMFISPRTLAEKWDQWTPESIKERTDILCQWAIKRWPHSI